MNKYVTVKYLNAKFTIVADMDIVCEINGFVDCVSQEPIPFRTVFDKDKGYWTFAKLPEKDFSPFKQGQPVPEHLQQTLFEIAQKYNLEDETETVEEVINF
tara:strand:+ start:521 stop:823 length:303 start_codon:yes stop_codon:yes gene_type:complete